MKLTLIGAGALRTLGVLRDVLCLPTLRGATVHLMDLDAERVETIGRLACAMPEAVYAGAVIEWGTDLSPALDGADYVYLVIRVGGVESMERDERLAAEQGFHGHDDFGPSAFFIALRTLPVVLRLAAEIEQRCPRAWVINFTNPVPLLVHTLQHYTPLRAVGLCGGDRNMAWDLAALMGYPREMVPRFDYDAVGLDHFGWGLRMRLDGQDFYPLLEQRLAELEDRSGLAYYLRWTIETYDTYGAAPFASAHCFHWLYHDAMCRSLAKHLRQSAPQGDTRAGRQDEAHHAARALLERGLEGRFWEHPELDAVREDPLFEAPGARLLRGLTGAEPVRMVVCRLNEDACANLPPEAITEYSAHVEPDGLRPAVHDPVPAAVAGLTQAILEHQRLLVESAVTGHPRTLRQAWYADPLQRDRERGDRLLDDLLAANRGQIAESLFG